MARTLRPLSLGQILDETFNIYRNNFMLFLTISAIPNAIILVLQVGLDSAINTKSGSGMILITLGGLVDIFAAMFATSLVTAATTLGVSDIYLDTPTTAAACFSRVSPKVLRVLAVSLGVGVIIVLGCILLIIPGIYAAVLYGLAIPAVVLEEIAPSEAFTRSSVLTRESVWRVVLVYFLTTIFASIMTWSQHGVTNIAGLTGTHSPHKEIWDSTVSTVCTILFGPISAIALTLTYYDQRIRREAFDISHMMSLMNKTETNSKATL